MCREADMQEQPARSPRGGLLLALALLTAAAPLSAQDPALPPAPWGGAPPGPPALAPRAARAPAAAPPGPARPRAAAPPAGASGLHAAAPGGGAGLPRPGPRPRLRPRGRRLGPLRGALAAAGLVLRHRAGPGLPGDQVPPHQRDGAEPARPRDRDPRRDR